MPTERKAMRRRAKRLCKEVDGVTYIDLGELKRWREQEREAVEESDTRILRDAVTRRVIKGQKEIAGAVSQTFSKQP